MTPHSTTSLVPSLDLRFKASTTIVRLATAPREHTFIPPPSILSLPHMPTYQTKPWPRPPCTAHPETPRSQNAPWPRCRTRLPTCALPTPGPSSTTSPHQARQASLPVPCPGHLLESPSGYLANTRLPRRNRTRTIFHARHAQVTTTGAGGLSATTGSSYNLQWPHQPGYDKFQCQTTFITSNSNSETNTPNNNKLLAIAILKPTRLQPMGGLGENVVQSSTLIKNELKTISRELYHTEPLDLPQRHYSRRATHGPSRLNLPTHNDTTDHL